ncbi:hypothetical protein ME9_00082 [Bartonella taylorii 8TBB]|uniref:Uncharacterized protein n=1 Tax=Bartonella taylorii 8TBB TaxID=1094560 RepID=A0A9P2S2J6_BARTA|nr:hypothetical protein ME9_00082 [Bartonella taylorii 8TBB]
MTKKVLKKNTENDERSGFPLLRSCLPLRGSGHHYDAVYADIYTLIF